MPLISGIVLTDIYSVPDGRKAVRNVNSILRRAGNRIQIMIILTKLNGQKFALNYHLVETIQENPDTTIKLSNGNVYLVEEPLDLILKMISMYEKENGDFRI